MADDEDIKKSEKRIEALTELRSEFAGLGPESTLGDFLSIKERMCEIQREQEEILCGAEDKNIPLKEYFEKWYSVLDTDDEVREKMAELMDENGLFDTVMGFYFKDIDCYIEQERQIKYKLEKKGGK